MEIKPHTTLLRLNANVSPVRGMRIKLGAIDKGEIIP